MRQSRTKVIETDDNKSYKSVGMDPGKIIKAKREELGWSQKDLGERVGVSQVAIKKMEAGTTRKSKFFPKVAEVLSLDLSALDSSLTPGTTASTSSSVDARIAEVLQRIPAPLKESWLQIMLNSLPPEEAARYAGPPQDERPSKRR